MDIEARRRQTRREAIWGGLLSLFAGRSDRRRLHAAALVNWLYPLARLKQLRVFKDEDGYSAAYLAWAFLSPSTLEDLAEGCRDQLHISEWNEGTQLVVLDVFGTGEQIPGLISIALNEVFPLERAVILLRPKAGRLGYRPKAFTRGQIATLARRIERATINCVSKKVRA